MLPRRAGARPSPAMAIAPQIPPEILARLRGDLMPLFVAAITLTAGAASVTLAVARRPRDRALLSFGVTGGLYGIRQLLYLNSAGLLFGIDEAPRRLWIAAISYCILAPFLDFLSRSLRHAGARPCAAWLQSTSPVRWPGSPSWHGGAIPGPWAPSSRGSRSSTSPWCSWRSCAPASRRPGHSAACARPFASWPSSSFARISAASGSPGPSSPRAWGCSSSSAAWDRSPRASSSRDGRGWPRSGKSSTPHASSRAPLLPAELPRMAGLDARRALRPGRRGRRRPL